jgi:hypothetical protein
MNPITAAQFAEAIRARINITIYFARAIEGHPIVNQYPDLEITDFRFDNGWALEPPASGTCEIRARVYTYANKGNHNEVRKVATLTSEIHFDQMDWVNKDARWQVNDLTLHYSNTNVG